MEPLFFELTEVLKKQKEIVANMVDAAEAQNTALRELNAEKINAAVQELNKLTLKMAKYDPQREELQVKLENQLGLKKGAVLSDLINAAPLEIKRQLTELQGELKAHFDKLQQLNQLNSVLTKRALQTSTAVLKILNPTAGGTYHGDGRVTAADRPQSVLNKTV